MCVCVCVWKVKIESGKGTREWDEGRREWDKRVGRGESVESEWEERIR